MPILQAQSITKLFDGVPALQSVNFDLEKAEIHALLGENGAGKSTLMNILSGQLRPTNGEILIDNQAVKFHNPNDAVNAGIGMVNQHFHLVPVFAVLENLILGVQRTGFGLSTAKIRDRAQTLCDQLNWRLPMSARTGDLPVGVQQRVEILKALLLEPRILFFDEPTAVLTPSEADELFVVLRKLREQGKSIVFVSHKLGEVMALSDRVTILRRGKLVGAVAVRDTNEADLAQRMVGSELEPQTIRRPKKPQNAPVVLSIQKLSTKKMGRDDTALIDLTFSIGQGEILGVAGVDGNGQSELFEALTGLRPIQNGQVTLLGEKQTNISCEALMNRGIAWIPPDRQQEGLALSLSVAQNLMLSRNAIEEFRNGPFLNPRKMRVAASAMMERNDIRAVSPNVSASSLSGGNQQKIVIARALAQNPKLLIAASPTRGLDVGATAFVHQKLRECRERGASILLISTELDEIRQLSDRIIVLYEGQIMGTVTTDAPLQQLGLMMGGQSVGGTT